MLATNSSQPFEYVSRREFKYLVSEEKAAAIRQAAAPFCHVDAATPAGAKDYLISTLYLDNRSLELFSANDREVANRFKLRVRTYPENDGGQVFFEVKRRFNDAIAKIRSAVPKTLWRALLEDPHTPLPELPAHARGACKQFLALVANVRATPKALVQYRREALVSWVDPYARITFDRHVVGQPLAGMSLAGDAKKWRSIDNPTVIGSNRSLTVLELKFGGAPRWMRNIVQTFELTRGSFSKYYRSVLACGIEEQAEPEGGTDVRG